MSSTTLASLIHGAIALVLVASVTVLLALHDLTEVTAVALYGVALTAVGAATGIQLAKDIPADKSN